jgi:hypothetical protein
MTNNAEKTTQTKPQTLVVVFLPDGGFDVRFSSVAGLTPARIERMQNLVLRKLEEGHRKIRVALRNQEKERARAS